MLTRRISHDTFIELIRRAFTTGSVELAIEVRKRLIWILSTGR